MAYKIVYKKSVERDLKILGQDEAAKILNQIEKDLSNEPERQPTLRGHFAGLRKFGVGDYRVIYALFEDHVLILRIGHGREVYCSKV